MLNVFSPVGTDEVITVSRPYGTRGLLIALYPALKCGANIARPYGAKKSPLVVENDPTHVLDVHGSTPLDLCESFDAIYWPACGPVPPLAAQAPSSTPGPGDAGNDKANI